MILLIVEEEFLHRFIVLRINSYNDTTVVIHTSPDNLGEVFVVRGEENEKNDFHYYRTGIFYLVSVAIPSKKNHTLTWKSSKKLLIVLPGVRNYTHVKRHLIDI